MKCPIHKRKLVRIPPFCPACRGAGGGTKTQRQKTRRERLEASAKALNARWGKPRLLPPTAT